jgi:hypothetical protein
LKDATRRVRGQTNNAPNAPPAGRITRQRCQRTTTTTMDTLDDEERIYAALVTVGGIKNVHLKRFKKF